MNFFNWHYSEGISFYLKRYWYSLRFINHYFSLTLLLPTLFAPWKRLVTEKTRPGFDFREAFERVSFNLVSRFMGATVRILLFIIGIITLLTVLIFGAMGLLLWVLLPFLSINIYAIKNRQPKNIVGRIIININNNIETAVKQLFDNNAGEFVLNHLGLDMTEIVANAKQDLTEIKGIEITTYEGLIKWFIEKGTWDDQFFRSKKILKEDMLKVAAWWDKKQGSETEINETPKIGKPGIGLELLFGYTPTLNKYSTDLSLEQDFSNHLIGRGNIVNRMERVLNSGNSIVLVGQPGVGKRTVVLEFARKAAYGELGHKMSFRRVMELDFSFLFSESTDLNKKKAILAGILAETSTAGNIILVMRDLHRVTHQALEGLDFTDVFERYLEKRELMMIAISTDTEHERYFAQNMRLRKYFEPIEVVQPNMEEAMEILIEFASVWEKKKKLVISFKALKKIMEGSDRYVTETPFPEKALELLDAVVTYCEQQDDENAEITDEDVNVVLSERTGVSFASLTKNEKQKLSNLEEIIHEKLVDQELAVKLISQILRGKSVGVIDSKRPIGSFLFLGPTGVGKTETAKVLAKVYFGSEEEIIRFDMAEYAGEEGLERLIGNATQNRMGVLTSAIRKKPASLLLLDEIEKAPKEVFNLFLSLLDEGSMTDAFGRKIIGSNLFIVATSNAGSEYIRQLVNEKVSGEELSEKLTDYVLKQGFFSPEFVNRFDGVVVYQPLGETELFKIAKIKLQNLAQELRAKNILVEFSEDATYKLAKDGFEPAFGARPMRRIIEINIGDMIGKGILSEEIKPGEKIVVEPGVQKGEFIFCKANN